MVVLFAFSLVINALLIVLLNQQNRKPSNIPQKKTLPQRVLDLKHSSFENLISSSVQNPPQTQTLAESHYEFLRLLRNLEKQIHADNNRDFAHETLDWLLSKSESDFVMLDFDTYQKMESALLELQDMTLIKISHNVQAVVHLNCQKIKFYQKYLTDKPIEEIASVWGPISHVGSNV